MPERILIGTAWPYANGPLHLGHVAGCYLPADIFARYNRMVGNEVLMVSGSDMHGTPITVRADQEGVDPAVIAERYHQSFLQSWKDLGISFDLFTNTHTENHATVTQEIFTALKDNGYMYPQVMEAPYCANENRFLPDRYVEGTCPHCGATQARGDQCDNCGRTLTPGELVDARCKFCSSTPSMRETEHYFFKLSAFTERLLEWTADKTWWKPNVIGFTRGFLQEGLKDSAITRDISWGVKVPVPGYENKRIYVWFEAVIGYLSATKEWAAREGRPDDWRRFWQEPSRSYYFIGKDNIVFHTIRWPATLMGVGGLNLPYDVPSNEFLTLQGKQFSTSRNWAVWVPDFQERYDPDPLRYVLAANSPETNDADFSWGEYVRRNNDELVAAYGNLVHRCTTFVHKHFGKIPPAERDAADQEILDVVRAAFEGVGERIAACRFKEALKELMAVTQAGNRYFDAQAPWKAIKTDKARAGTILNTTLNLINNLRLLYSPYLPFSSAKLQGILGSPPAEAERWEYAELPVGQKLGTPEALFKKYDESVVADELARLDDQPPGMSHLGADPERVARYYDEHLFEYESGRLEAHNPVEYTFTCRELGRRIPAGAHVADIGVGAGHYAEFLARRGCHVQLVDVSQRLLEAAEMRVRGVGEGNILGVDRATATDLKGFPSNAFDAVLLLGPLYHLSHPEDRRRAVREAWRLLKPQGLLFAAGINRLSYLRYAFSNRAEGGAESRDFHLQFLKDGIVDETHAPHLGSSHLTTVDEFDGLFDRLSFKKLALLGPESFTGVEQKNLSHIAQEDVDAWLELVELTASTPEGLAASDHFLYIGEKLLLIA